MVGVWGLPMVMIFMCILLGSHFVFFLCVDSRLEMYEVGVPRGCLIVLYLGCKKIWYLPVAKYFGTTIVPLDVIVLMQRPTSLPTYAYLYVWLYGWCLVFFSNDVHFKCMLLWKRAGQYFFGYRNTLDTSSVRFFNTNHLICVQIGSIWVHIDVLKGGWPKMLLSACNVWYVHVDPLIHLQTRRTWKPLEV